MQENRKEREAWKRATFGFHYGMPATPPQPAYFAGPKYTYRCVRERREFTELDKRKACPKCGGRVQLVKKRKR